jgi:hypothetical protein
MVQAQTSHSGTVKGVLTKNQKKKRRQRLSKRFKHVASTDGGQQVPSGHPNKHEY